MSLVLDRSEFQDLDVQWLSRERSSGYSYVEMVGVTTELKGGIICAESSDSCETPARIVHVALFKMR